MAYVTPLPYGDEVEVTDNLERGPYFYGSAVFAWIKYWLGIDPQYCRRAVIEKDTALIN